MSHILADLRLALRTWRKSPGFTAIAIASIALGIGANAAIFTLVDQVLLRTLPVKDLDSIVQISYIGSAFGNNWGDGRSCRMECSSISATTIRSSTA